MVKRLVKALLSRAGYEVFNTRTHHARDGLFTLHSDRFSGNASFREAYARGLQANAGINPGFEWRVHVALWTAANSIRVPGDFVECGVNTGFVSSAIMRHLNWRTVEKRFYLVDTFSGPVLQQYSPEETRQGQLAKAEKALAAGAYAIDVDRVRANFAEWPNAVIVEGAVPDVLPSLNIPRIAFLHLDMNCAYPERAALEFFWDRLSPGAAVLLDDYAHTGCQAQSEAIEAAAATLGAGLLALPTGQGLIIR